MKGSRALGCLPSRRRVARQSTFFNDSLCPHSAAQSYTLRGPSSLHALTLAACTGVATIPADFHPPAHHRRCRISGSAQRLGSPRSGCQISGVFEIFWRFLGVFWDFSGSLVGSFGEYFSGCGVHSCGFLELGH